VLSGRQTLCAVFVSGAKNTCSAWAILLAIISSGCARPSVSTFQTDPKLAPLLSLSPKLRRAADIMGEVSLQAALRQLVSVEVLVDYPPISDPSAKVIISPLARILDVVKEVETVTGWVYDSDRLAFDVASATHTMDNPDAFGRPQSEQVPRSSRAIVRVEFRFRRVAAGVSLDPRNFLSADGTLTTFSASVPDGVDATWATTDERGYFDAVQGTDGATSQIRTTRRTVSSGIQMTALTSRLPGQIFRIDGTLEVSAFTGSQLDRSVISVPLQLDGPRYVWVPVFRTSSLDASLKTALRGRGVTADLSGSDVLLELRVF
jgi:hypothetical protein